MIYHTPLKHAAYLGLLFAVATSPLVLLAQEWEEHSSYYEDDAWYDITEWFDGNDYNSTNETVYDTDNDYDTYEYDYSNDTEPYSGTNAYDDNYGAYEYEGERNNESGVGYDYDLDNSYGTTSDWWYGYDNRYDDGYSYYNDHDDDGLFDFNYRFYDWDNDGLYDAYSTYSDWDSDGVYEDWDYYSLNDIGNSSSRKNQAQQQASSQSSSKTVRGEVVQSKRVTVKDTQNQLIEIKQSDGQNLFVDLGPAHQLNDFDISNGDRITVDGPMTQVGNKRLLIAQSLTAGNNSAAIDRNRRQFRGTIDGMRTVQGRGQQNQIVVLRNDSGKSRMVDLGATDKLDIDLSKGEPITVRGPLVKINDREIVLAQTVTRDGEQRSIDRRQR